MFRAAIPVLHVSDSAGAEDFYCRKLGFSREFAYRPGENSDPCYLGLVRDHARIHLSSFRDDSVAGASVYVYVDDVDGLHAEFVRRRVMVDLPPTDQTWGNREMYVRDPDRNKIAFVQESKA
jgi:catechol 2,3-dioxygenase-like lactoylglutathione lyase family enzyme